MSGRVIPGSRLGRSLGMPTVNLRPGRRVLPMTGVFAVLVHGADETPRPGVANLGTRPTVGGGQALLEAHLFDYSGDLYGRHLAVEFVVRLRDELRFDNVALLAEQMRRDAARARQLLDVA
jgi:riboflavin kinase/FMN adenylyltransferase